MEVRLIKEENSTDAILSVNIKLEDFIENVEKILKSEKQKLNLPGFRKGMVPTGIAKQYLWEPILKDELEKKLEITVNSYFEENQIEIIKPVLPLPPAKMIDLKNDKEFEFTFDIGLVDEININQESIFNHIKQYDIKVEKTDIDEELEKICVTYGEFKTPDIIEDNDEFKVMLEFTELNNDNQPLEGGIKQKFYIDLLGSNPKLRKLLIGKAKNESFEIDINEVFDNKEELADLLKVEKLTIEDANPTFSVKVVVINHNIKAELNDELVSKITNGKISGIEDFYKDVEGMIQGRFDRSSDHLLFDEIMQALIEKVELKMPEKFLNRLFEEELKEKEEKLSDEERIAERKEFVKRLKWSILTDHISKKNNLEVNEEEIVREAYYHVSSYFMQYGMSNVPADQMQKYVTDYLKNQSNVAFMKERVQVNKVLEHIKNDYNFVKEEISLVDFNKIHEEKHPHEHNH